MTGFRTRVSGIAALVALLAAPAWAVGPVDGEVDAVWWASDYKVDNGFGSATVDAGAPGLKAELWLFERYGFRAAQFTASPDNPIPDDTDYLSVDLMWKAIAPTENNFFAFGLGYQEFDLAGIDLSNVETSGMRATVEGRVGFVGMVYGYGEASYLPKLDDTNASTPQMGRFEDMESLVYELGVGWNVAPFVTLRGGWRQSMVDYTQTQMVGPVTEMDGSVDSQGFFAGLGVNF